MMLGAADNRSEAQFFADVVESFAGLSAPLPKRVRIEALGYSGELLYFRRLSTREIISVARDDLLSERVVAAVLGCDIQRLAKIWPPRQGIAETYNWRRATSSLTGACSRAYPKISAPLMKDAKRIRAWPEPYRRA